MIVLTAQERRDMSNIWANADRNSEELQRQRVLFALQRVEEELDIQSPNGEFSCEIFTQHFKNLFVDLKTDIVPELEKKGFSVTYHQYRDCYGIRW